MIITQDLIDINIVRSAVISGDRGNATRYNKHPDESSIAFLLAGLLKSPLIPVCSEKLQYWPVNSASCDREELIFLGAVFNEISDTLLSIDDIKKHYLYQRIKQLSKDNLDVAISFLKLRPLVWICVLHEATGVNPVPMGERMSIPKIVEAWEQWYSGNQLEIVELFSGGSSGYIYSGR